MPLSEILKYLAANIVGMLAVRLANIADGILIGHIVGPEGLAGVTLCQPVMQVIFSFYTFLVLSNAMLMGMSIGKGDKDEASQKLAFGMKAGMVIGITVCTIGYLFFDQLSALLCHSDILRPYTNEYLRVILIAAIPQMGMYALNQFVTIDGSPLTVSRIAILGNILNVCLDIIFMKYFGWGITGAAMATLMMYVVCVWLLLRHKFVHTNSLRQAMKQHTQWMPHLKKVVHFGFPMFLSTMLLTVQFASNNTITTVFLGTDAMIVLAVCMQLYDFSLIILTGSMSTIQPLGARLHGAGNESGLLKLYLVIYSFIMVAALVYCGSIALFPVQISRLLGLHLASRLAIAAQALPPFAAYLAVMPIVYMELPVYQMYERKALTYVHSLGVTLVPPLCFAIYAMLDTTHCWWGLAIGDMLVLLTLVIITEIIRHRDKTLIPVLLIKREER